MRRALPVAAGIAATAAAFALFTRLEWAWAVLAWVALVPWLAVLEGAPTLARTLAAAWALSAATVVAVYGWFGLAVADYTGVPATIVLIALVVLGPLIEPQFLAFAAAGRRARRSGAGWARTALTGACAYVATEWLVPKLFADSMGHALYGSALWRQAADLAGVPGLTFVLLLGNGCAWAALHAGVAAPPRRRLRAAAAPALAGALLVATLTGYGVWAYRAYGPAAADGVPLRAGIVQASISHYEEMARDIGTYAAVRTILDTYFAMSGQLLDGRADRPDVLVWPETVYPTTFGTPKSDDGAAFDAEIVAFVDRAGVPLVFGAYDRDGAAEFNAGVFLEPSADGQRRVTMYRKTLLFPLTERVPALLDRPALRRWLPWLGTWTPGDGARVISLRLADGRTVRIAPLICYDTIQPDLAIDAVRGGAELIVTLSNDSWFDIGPGPGLHLMVAAFRSIETRRAQLRATNTGISTAITPTGDLLGTLGVGARGALVASVLPDRRATTLLVAWGDWLGPLALAAALVLLAVPARASARLARTP